ncbi:hypothetical protein SRHO_G00116750 [Serrasalmus rhombeus]
MSDSAVAWSSTSKETESCSVLMEQQWKLLACFSFLALQASEKLPRTQNTNTSSILKKRHHSEVCEEPSYTSERMKRSCSSAREEKTQCIPAVGPAAVCFRTEIEGKKNSGGGVVWSSKTRAKLQQACTVPGDHVVSKATGGHLWPGRGGGA